MKTELDLIIASAPGIQLRVANRLKNAGLQCTSRKLRDWPLDPSNKCLSMEFDGPALSREEVRQCLADVHGIVAIDRLICDGVSMTLPVTKPEPAATPADKTPAPATEKPATSAAAQSPSAVLPIDEQAELRDRMLIFSLLSRYPKVAVRLAELKNGFPEAERGLRVQQLGQGFGQHLARQRKGPPLENDLSDVLTNLVMPAVTPMADAVLHGSTIEVTTSKVNLKPKKPQPEACQFMLGTLQGLVASAGELPPHAVSEQTCVLNGDDCCRFVFERG